MKKKIITLILVLTVIICSFVACSGGDEATPKEPLNTEPVEVKLVSAEYENGEIKRKYEYDANGNRTLYVWYSSEDGSERWRTEYEYDEMNNVVHILDTRDGEVTETRSKYTYDKNGNIRTKVSLDDKEENCYEYKYNKKGEKTEEKLITNGIKQHHFKYYYDNEGKKVKEEAISRNGMIGTVINYEYDEKGNVLSEVMTYQGEQTSKSVYAYDENGNLTDDTYFDEEGESIHEHYVFDEKGNKIEWISYFEGDFSSRTIYEYNENGKVTKEMQFEYENDKEPFFTYTYKYDKDGYVTEHTMHNREDEKPDVTSYEYITVSIPSYRLEEVMQDQEIIVM